MRPLKPVTSRRLRTSGRGAQSRSSPQPCRARFTASTSHAETVAVNVVHPGQVDDQLGGGMGEPLLKLRPERRGAGKVHGPVEGDHDHGPDSLDPDVHGVIFGHRAPEVGEKSPRARTLASSAAIVL